MEDVRNFTKHSYNMYDYCVLYLYKSLKYGHMDVNIYIF